MAAAGKQPKNRKKEPVHAGHRERLRKKLTTYGGFVMSDLDILEMLLYYVLPRIDTRPIAQELLAKFGSLKGVLDADGSALREVRGIKDNAEALFILLRQVSLRDTGTAGIGDFREASAAKDLLLRVYKGVKTESVFAMYLDSNGALLDSGFVFKGGISSARFPLRAVTEGVIRCRGSAVIIAHNHPSGSVIPSNDDILTTNRIASHFAANDIDLIEHYIVGNNECAGIMARKIFDDSE